MRALGRDAMRTMETRRWMRRICEDPAVCGGRPCVRGTRIEVAIILDGLAEGLTPEQLRDHYPHLTLADIRAALAYAAVQSRDETWKLAAQGSNTARPFPVSSRVFRPASRMTSQP